MPLKKIDNNIFIPMPMGIVGVNADGRENYMAAGWITRVNAAPPMIGVAVNRRHLTASAIFDNKEFSLSFPGKNLIAETDYVGIYSGSKTDKSKIFKCFYGGLKKSPIVENAIVAFECQLVETVILPTNTFYIGEIVGAWADGNFCEGSRIDYKNGDAFMMTMPDNSYWSLGEYLGKSWDMGRSLDKQE